MIFFLSKMNVKKKCSVLQDVNTFHMSVSNFESQKMTKKAAWLALYSKFFEVIWQLCLKKTFLYKILHSRKKIIQIWTDSMMNNDRIIIFCLIYSFKLEIMHAVTLSNSSNHLLSLGIIWLRSLKTGRTTILEKTLQKHLATIQKHLYQHIYNSLY